MEHRDYAFTLPQLHDKAKKHAQAKRNMKVPRDCGEDTLAYKFYTMRLDRGLSLNDCAAKLECSASLLSQIEREIHTPSLKVIQRAADAFRVPLHEMFVGVRIYEAYIPL